MENEVNTIVKPVKSFFSISFKILAVTGFLIGLVCIIVLSVGWKEFVSMQRRLIYVQQQMNQQQKQSQITKNEVTNLQHIFEKSQQQIASARLLPRLQGIENLLQEADLNLHYHFNLYAAINLLKIAEQQAASLPILGLKPFKEKLTYTITALQLLPKVDRAEILLKLASLQQQINALPVYNAPKVLTQPVREPTFSKISDWHKNLEAAWLAFQKIIIIRHNTVPVAPLLAPEQYLYVKQNIQQQLAQAEWAVIEQQDSVYQASLQQAINWLQQFYATNTTSTALIKLLQELKSNVLKPPSVPDLTGLLAVIADLQQETKP